MSEMECRRSVWTPFVSQHVHRTPRPSEVSKLFTIYIKYRACKGQNILTYLWVKARKGMCWFILEPTLWSALMNQHIRFLTAEPQNTFATSLNENFIWHTFKLCILYITSITLKFWSEEKWSKKRLIIL